MSPEKRRIIAFIAGRLISGRHSSSIYDASSSLYTYVSGIVSPKRVHVYDYDYDRSNFISGSKSEAAFSLYDYATNHFIQLTIDGNKFEGYDEDSYTHFNGTVKGNSITLHEGLDSQDYNYSVQPSITLMPSPTPLHISLSNQARPRQDWRQILSSFHSGIALGVSAYSVDAAARRSGPGT